MSKRAWLRAAMAVCFAFTSNPAIFEKAIASDSDYRADLEEMHGQGLSPAETLVSLVLPDIQAAAGRLRAVYADTTGRNGYVSLEVPPTLAHDTDATLAEARRLWRAVGCDNLMIKVPATEAGLPAVTALITRFRSRKDHTFASAMRQGFGGHAEPST